MKATVGRHSATISGRQEMSGWDGCKVYVPGEGKREKGRERRGEGEADGVSKGRLCVKEYLWGCTIYRPFLLLVG